MFLRSCRVTENSTPYLQSPAPYLRPPVT
jgi:hypothetical protein